jgi:UDP-2,3-diacylglucosamine pyrophosphatase LpxH
MDLSESRMSDPVVSHRIVSDLHFAEHGSRVRHLRTLEALFDGPRQVVFNGDTIETRFLDMDPAYAVRRDEFQAFTARWGERLIVMTGNHDPDVSRIHHLELCDGHVLITHGDILFPDLAPWGWEARYFRKEMERTLALEPAEVRSTLEAHLRAAKHAVVAMRDLSPRYPGPSSHPWERRLRFLLAIRRIDRILGGWRETPDRTAALAERFRPQARAVIAGHVHRPGVWAVRGRWAINTGSMVPPLGAFLVDVVGRELHLRRWRVRKDVAEIGPVFRRIDLDAPVPARA